MGGGAGMTQDMVFNPRKRHVGAWDCFQILRFWRLNQIFLNFNTFLSHRDPNGLRLSATGKCGCQNPSLCLDSSRRNRCQSTSRAHSWLRLLLPFRHVQYGPQQSLKAKQTLALKSLLLSNLHRSRKSRCLQVNTSNLVSGQAFAPVPYHPTAMGVV